jgi:MFS family permease
VQLFRLCSRLVVLLRKVRQHIYAYGGYDISDILSLDALTLDILRGFQGLGSAATIPASLGILAHSFPPSPMRSIAFATFAAGAPVGGAFGLTLGGVITQKASYVTLTLLSNNLSSSFYRWRGIFYLAFGLTILCIISALSFDADPPLPRGDYRHTEDGKEKEISASEDRRVDWLGAFLVTAGLVLVIFALSDGPVDGWKTSCQS